MTPERAQHVNTIIAIVVLGIVIAVVCIVGYFTFNEVEEILQGQAEVTEYRISSKIPGRILEFRVKEGQSVKAGDTLAIIEAPDIEAKQAQAMAAQSAAQAQSQKAEKGAREEQIQGAYELWQKAKVGVDIMEKSFKRVENLYNEGVVSEQKYDETKAQYEAAVATEKAAKSQYDMAVNGAQQEDKDMAAAMVRRAKGAVAEVNSYIAEAYLTAYADGEVTEIFPHVGELVGTGAPIMNVAMLDDQWVSFNVNEMYLKDMRMGSQFEAYIPALDITTQMTVTYLKDVGEYAAWKATKQTGQYDLRTFEVRATPNHIIDGFRPGMTVIYKMN
ncbi:MAG: biotin/lipoyl-binding protein [Bacteroidales bacterium]|nr:biotin/lipoyl-binding protein [Bacteroidales bacterium]